MPEQPDKCHEHHMLLKEKIDKVVCVLFGCADNPKEIPLVNCKPNIVCFIL